MQLRMLLQTALAGSGLLMAFMAHAEVNWALLRETPSGTSFYYSKQSVQKEKGVGYVTVLTNTNPTSFNNIVFQSKLSRERVDCRKATYDTLHSELYSEKFAEGVKVFASQPSSQPLLIVPGSWMEDMYKAACSGGR